LIDKETCRRPLRAVDLFCGAGGFSAGLTQACDELGLRLDLTAIDYNSLAIATHARNHPTAKHQCGDVRYLDPSQVVSGAPIDLLIASPPCTHFSSARGGHPCISHSRELAWVVIQWAKAFGPRHIIVENVPQFASWGPLNYYTGKPISARKGELYSAWRASLQNLGYHVEHRVINAADHGDVTTRKRLFVVATRDSLVNWPSPTHDSRGRVGLPPWRAAREIIDWSLPSQSIFTRTRPLAPKTIARIAAGLRRFCGECAEPFLDALYGTSGARCVDLPLPSITAGGPHLRLVQPCGVKGLVESRVVVIDGRSHELDIRSRMLRPRELANAMSFPATYQFGGTLADQVRQIGNAISVRTAAAVCKEVIR
jgi:DNA (cytosine-5)-methyltransferase 1